MNSSHDQHIIAEVLQGDVQAFGLLVKQYEKPLYNLMYRITKSTDSAEDLTQDAFIRAYEKLERFKPGKKFFPWLYTIGLNIGRDFLRKTGASKVLSVEETDDILVNVEAYDQQDRVLDTLEFRKIEKAIDKLPLKYREALILYYREELLMKDIAIAMEVSVSGAKSRVKRGLSMLRKSLGV
jgi:RNA polymerase sigma-70 factor (ECF subfamily)